MALDVSEHIRVKNQENDKKKIKKKKKCISYSITPLSFSSLPF